MCGMLKIEEDMHVWGEGEYRESLYIINCYKPKQPYTYGEATDNSKESSLIFFNITHTLILTSGKWMTLFSNIVCWF